MSTRLTNGVYTFADGESDWGTLMNSNLQLLDNLVGNHGSTVSFSQTLTSGVKIGKITINGTEIELYHTDYSGKADATSVYTKTEVNNLLEDKADADDLTTHTDDDDIHVTALQKQSWTNKQDALTDEQLENIDSISDLDEKYISADDTTIVKLTNLNEINLQEDHYNAWIGYRGGEVTNWKFGNGTEGGYADVYANDFYLNDESLSDILDDLSVDSQGTNYIRYANGLQICWGNISIENTNGASVSFHITFSKSFNGNIPFVTMSFVGSNSRETLGGLEGITTTECAGFYSSYSNKQIHYIAIGYWK